jgi:ADP-ribosylglycohydrolase
VLLTPADYAEAADGSTFVAGMLSLAFVERGPKQIVRKAARLIDPISPYRQALDQTISLAESQQPFHEIAIAIQARRSAKYQSTNSAVINGTLIALAVWFGEGDFSKTVNLALRAGDFTDTDCNAATAAAVVGGMHRLKALPKPLVDQLGDRMRGEQLAGVRVTPPLDESVIDIARRTVAVGEKFVRVNGGSVEGRSLTIAV